MRYEEYAVMPEGLPLVLFEDIVRTPSRHSAEQNWHDTVELQLATEGEGCVLIDGERHPLRAGDIALIPSDAIHYTYSDTSLTYSCLIVGAEFCLRMGIDHRTLSFPPVVRSEALAALFSAVREAYHAEAPFRTARLSHSLLSLLLALLREYAAEGEGRTVDGRALSGVKRALLYLREHFAERVTLDAVARAALLDKYTLAKSFKKYTGETVVTYLTRYRCLCAGEYLAAGCSVGEAAELSGFGSLSFFTKIYKRYMGELPSKRKKEKR